ncbi:MAG: glycosyltransferase [Bacteroidota bacterium]
MTLLFISHEASLTGAPKVLLHFMRWLKANRPDVNIIILLGRGGAVEDEFQELGTTYVWHEARTTVDVITSRLLPFLKTKLSRRQRAIVSAIKAADIDLVYGNTVLAAPLMEALSLDVPSVLHVHELKYNVERYGYSEALLRVLNQVDRVIAVSRLVYDYFHKQQQIEEIRLRLIHEFIEPIDAADLSKKVLTDLPEGAFVIGGCGTINWRKGTDLFVQVAHQVLSQFPDRPIYFVWLGGNLKHHNYYELQHDVDKLGWTDHILFLGNHKNPQDFFARFDLFLMTSREDPFPLVCLENAQLGNPIICFEDAVGSQEFIDERTGGVVSYLDTKSMAEAVIDYYEYPKRKVAAGQKIQRAVAEYTVDEMAPKLWNVLEEVSRK